MIDSANKGTDNFVTFSISVFIKSAKCCATVSSHSNMISSWTCKIIFILSACGASKKEIAMHDEDFRGCERIVTSFRHLIYKCPAKMAWVWETKRQDADEMFKTVKDIDWTVANADTEHTLIEVVLKRSEICPERFYYRTTEKSVDGKDAYTIVGCK